MEEFFYHCPYCNALISALIEPVPAWCDYEEDCEVCCRPIRLRFRVIVTKSGDFAVRSFSAVTIEDL